MKDVGKRRRLFLLIAIPIFLFIGGIFVAYNYQKLVLTKNSNAVTVEKVQEQLAVLQQKLMRKEFKRLISDLFIIKDIVKEDLNLENHQGNFSNSIKSMKSILSKKKVYDQIRYIDENGNEVIRLDLKDGKSVVAKKSDLQNKGDRYYFIDSMKLDKGEVYVSKLDLNMERGEIEMPEKPMIRLSTKVFDKNGNERGIIIINYLAKIMIEDFVNVSKSSTGSSYLLNSDSYWISNLNDPETEFAFMYDDKKEMNFKNKYPMAYKQIFENNVDVFEDDKNIFFAKKVVTFDDSIEQDSLVSNDRIVLGDGNLVIIAPIEENEMKNVYLGTKKETFFEIAKEEAIMLLIIFILSLLLSFVCVLYIERRRRKKIISEYDVTSGVLNRRAGIQRTKKLIEKTRNKGTELGLIFVDVNGLKSVNDILGHPYGDELIKISANIMKETIRDKDILFRYGGDEFVMCLEKINYSSAETLWQRILSNLSELNQDQGLKYNISLSHGVSVISPEEQNVDLEKYIEEADEKMYKEKLEIKKNLIVVKDRKEQDAKKD